MTSRALILAVLGVLPARAALAQAPMPSPSPSPSPPPSPSPSPEPPPLAQLRDDKQLAEALASITQDPSILVDDPKVRPLAQALMTEGVKQLQAHAYDQALANFLEAYAKLPSPRILLNIASTLRDMGRLADAANTYQRYLLDPASGADRIAEVKQLLLDLDEQLTILTVRVAPRGSDISIDGGPFVAVGSTLLTRVRPGIHLVRIRHDRDADEQTVNGFDGENKEVQAAIKMVVTGPDVPKPPDPKPPDPKNPPDVAHAPPAPPAPPDHVDAWLSTGTLYSTSDPTSRERHAKASPQGQDIAAIVPHYEIDDNNTAIVHVMPERTVSSGALGMLRIDGEGHGFAAGGGIAFAASDNIELEGAVLRSSEWGLYVGARYRFLTGQIRPYLGAGMPVFFFSVADDANPNMTTQHVGVGARGAGGVEIEINGHLSVEGDLGYEHFFNVSGTPFIANVFVPTLGVIGRL